MTIALTDQLKVYKSTTVEPATIQTVLDLDPKNAMLTNATTTVAAKVLIAEGTNNGTNKVTVTIPASLAADYTLTLPPDDGTSGQVLTTDGSGVTTWTSSTERATSDSTGIITGGLLSIGSPTTTFSISDGTGMVTDNTVVPATVTNVTWTGKTNITATQIAAGLVSYVGIDSGGNVVQQLAAFTNIQTRSIIVIGSLIHVNLTNLDAVNQFGDVIISPANQFFDLERALGRFNVSGNIFSANGANLNLNKSIGVVYSQGSNLATSYADPNTLSLASLTALTFQYRFSTGTNGTTGTAINPNIYDVGGVSTAVSNNKFTIQRIYLFVSNNVKIQPGQTEYNSLAEAKAAIQTQVFVTEPSISTNGILRGFLILKKGATSLQSASDVFFYEAGKFSQAVGIGGQSVSTMQNVYDNSTNPEVLTDTTRGAFSVKRGSAADTDTIYEGLNNAGSVTFSVTGEGTVAASGAITGSNLSGTNTGDQSTFSTIAVSGQSDIVADSGNDTLTVVAGSGITITTNAGADSITINATGGGTGDALVANPLSQFAATTSAQLAGVISDETGSGVLVFATSPTLVTPILGVAAATTINKVTVTTPATGSTLTIADGQTLTVNGSTTITNGTHSGTNTGDDAVNSLYSGLVSNATHTGDVTGATALTIDKTAITGKTLVTAAAGDHILVADASDTDNLKKVTVQTIVDLASTGSGVTDGDKGDIVVSGGGTVYTVDTDTVTYAKMQNVSATDKLLGRSTSGSGDVEEIACTAAGRAILDDADASAQRTTLGLVIGTNVQAYDADLQTLSTAFTTASASGPASLILAEDTDNGTNKITVSAPSSIVTDYTLTLPTTAGLGNQGVITDGSGNLSFANTCQVGALFFGDGVDGDLTSSSGTTTLTRDMYYNNVTLSGTAVLDTSNWKLFIAGTLDITAAPSNCIVNIPFDGGAASGTAAGAAPTTRKVAGSIATSNTGNGVIGRVGGTATGNIGNASASTGLAILSTAAKAAAAGGTGGSGSSGAGGQAGAAGSSTVNARLARNPILRDKDLAGTLWATEITGGGASNQGAGSGGGDGTAGGGSGGGGNGGGAIWLYAKVVNRGGSTGAACINAKGGAGGAGGVPAGGNRGGGGGGNGGDGGWVYMVVGSVTGSTGTNIIAADGGNGAAGGNGTGTGTGGRGGAGGAGGRVHIMHLTAGTNVATVGVAQVAAAAAPVTTTGGAGASGETTRSNL